jgi:TetR/AcrR family transcriptional regulator, repressor of fatR-cypB operon
MVPEQTPKRRGRPRRDAPPSSPEGSSTSDSEPDPLLEVALKLFVELGVDGTPVPMIAERAGVGVGTLYRRFASKEILVNRLFRYWKRAYASHLYFGFPSGKPVREKFHYFWSRLASFAQAHPDAFLFLESHHHGSYLDAESRALEQEVLKPVRRLLQSSLGGALKPLDAEALRAFVLGAFSSVVRSSRTGALELTPALLDALEECAWHAVAAVPQLKQELVDAGGAGANASPPVPISPEPPSEA